MLTLMLIPAEVWTAPSYDATYEGFDSNLIYTSGPVHLASGIAEITASPNEVAAANLATTTRRKLVASIDVTVLKNEGATLPLRIGVWSPWTGTGYFVAFGPAPDAEIKIETVMGGHPGATLLGGEVTSTAIAYYHLGSTYRVTFFVDRAIGQIRVGVSGADGVNVAASLMSSQSPAIFRKVQLSLAASSEGGSDTAHVILRNYTLKLPHERAWTSSVYDPMVKGLTIALASLGVIALALAAIARRWRPHILTWVPRRICAPWLTLGGLLICVAGNAPLFSLGGHPFDFANEQLYAYVARAYGPTHLYFLTDVTSLAGIWSGVPWVEAAFPYEAVYAYLFTGIGWLESVLFAGGGDISRASVQLGYVIKSVNLVFGLADGVLIYLILRELKVNVRWSRIGAALFIFNPAVWFSMSVWGQTHVISICFVLAAVLFAEKRILPWAWLALTAACLTRPQMVVFGILIGIVLLRKFPFKENVVALSWTVIVIFVSLMPLSLAISPSLSVDIMLHNWYVQEAGGNEASLTAVSQSAYSVWPLVTYLVYGASGLQRVYASSSTVFVGSLTYQYVGQVLTIGTMLLISAALVLRKREANDFGAYLPLVALGITTFLILLTGTVATHFLLALPLLLLCRRWMGTIAYLYAAAIWTVCTLVPMYGNMGLSLSSQQYPLLAAPHNPITRFFVDLYAWDRFITFGVVAIIVSVIWLAFLSFNPAKWGGPMLAPAAK